MDERTKRKRLSRFMKIAAIAGPDATAQICNELSGDRVYIPKADVFTREIRNEKIAEEWERGVPAFDLSRKYNLTPRRIYQIVNGNGNTGRMSSASLGL